MLMLAAAAAASAAGDVVRRFVHYMCSVKYTSYSLAVG